MSFPRYRHVTSGDVVELLVARPKFVTVRSCDTAIHASITADNFRRSFRPIDDVTELCDTCGGNGLLMCEHEDECPLDCWMTKDCPNPDCVGGRRVVTT